jgi:hypothetical protein
MKMTATEMNVFSPKKCCVQKTLNQDNDENPNNPRKVRKAAAKGERKRGAETKPSNSKNSARVSKP